MNLIVKSRPVKVFCSGSQAVNHLDEKYNGRTPDIIDNSYTIVEFENGVRAMLDLCMFAEVSRNQEELCAVGDKGKIEASLPDARVFVGQRKAFAIGNLPPSEEDRHGLVAECVETVDPTIRDAGYHEGSVFFEQQKFFAAVRGQGQVEVTVLDGLWAVAVGSAAERSIREGRPVTLAEVLGNYV